MIGHYHDAQIFLFLSPAGGLLDVFGVFFWRDLSPWVGQGPVREDRSTGEEGSRTLFVPLLLQDGPVPLFLGMKMMQQSKLL